MQQGPASNNARFNRASSFSLSLPLFSFLLSALLLASILIAAPAMSHAEMLSSDQELVALSDEDLENVTGGDYELALEGFEIMIADNEAGMFTMDIAQNAFDGAQGIFTTLQAVNSAVNLSVIVNIYLNGQGT